MARQKGIIKIKGKIGDISFYKTQDGHLAREKGGVDGDRIKNDPAFARTRENGIEFGSAASAGKLLRNALRPLLMTTADNRLTSRLTKTMTDIKNFDTTSLRGERTVATGIGDPAAKALLKGFDFNNRAVLSSVLFKPFTLNTSTGILMFVPGIVPANDIAYPNGATHVTIKGAWARINFQDGIYELVQSNAANMVIDQLQNSPAIIMSPPAAMTPGTFTDLFLLQIEFFQELNAVQYPLKNGAYNALAIVEVV